MQITCPDCSARYLVKPTALGENGRRVKCTRCKSVWFQEPPADQPAKPQQKVEAEPVETAPIPEGGNVPAITKKSSSTWWQKTACAASFLIFLCVTSYVMAPSLLNAAPWLSSYFNMMGVFDTEGVGMTDISVEQLQDGAKVKLVLDGKFVNVSDDIKPMPLLRVAVYSQSGKLLTDATLQAEQKVIESKQQVEFYNVIPSVSSSAARIVLDVGDSHALKRR